MRVIAMLFAAAALLDVAPPNGGTQRPANTPPSAATPEPKLVSPAIGVATPIPDTGEAMAGFVGMIDQRIDARASSADVAKLDAAIKAKYEKPMGVMITDMTGMTTQT